MNVPARITGSGAHRPERGDVRCVVMPVTVPALRRRVDYLTRNGETAGSLVTTGSEAGMATRDGNLPPLRFRRWGRPHPNGTSTAHGSPPWPGASPPRRASSPNRPARIATSSGASGHCNGSPRRSPARRCHAQIPLFRGIWRPTRRRTLQPDCGTFKSLACLKVTAPAADTGRDSRQLGAPPRDSRLALTQVANPREATYPDPSRDRLDGTGCSACPSRPWEQTALGRSHKTPRHAQPPARGGAASTSTLVQFVGKRRGGHRQPPERRPGLPPVIRPARLAAAPTASSNATLPPTAP